MNAIAPYWKAVLAFLAPAAGILIFACTDASDGGSVITQAEFITALCTAVVTGGGVYAVPNKDPKAQHQDESVQPPDGGDFHA